MAFLKDILGGINRCSNLDDETGAESIGNTQTNYEETDDDDTQSQIFEMQTSESVPTSTPRPGSSASTTTNTSEPRQNISRKRKVRPEMESIIKRNEELIALERKKIEILEKDANVEDDDDLLFFKSLLPHIKSLPVIKKLRLRSKIQELVLREIEEVANIESNQTRVTSFLSRPTLPQRPSSLEPPTQWNSFLSETDDLLNDTTY